MKEENMDILLSVIATILTGVASYLGILVKNFINDKTKKQVINDVVKYVEQVYTEIHGEEKFNQAVEIAIEVLNEKNITISETEIKMLIESTCCEFCKSGQNE